MIANVVHAESQQHPENSTPDNYCAYKGGVVIEGLGFLTTWGPEVWTALGTIVIATFTTILGLFTISLARSTRIAADASKVSADALMAAEGAHLYPLVDYSNLRHVLKGPTGYDDRPDNTPIPKTPRVVYTLKNHGKTPAFLERVMQGMTVSLKAGDMVQVVRPIEIIGGGRESKPFECIMLGESLNYGKAKAILSDTSMLLFYGDAIFKDFFGRKFQCIWEFSGDRGGFHMIRYEEHPQPDD